MLVYANQLNIVGPNALSEVFKTVAGWLKSTTSHHFTVDELTSGRDFKFDKQHVRTYVASQEPPALYAILFSNPDSEVRGRQWIAEIGIRLESSDNVYFSILLETSEISTQVRTQPITTKPKVITFLKENCRLSNDTVGFSVKTLRANRDDLKAFAVEIDRQSRKTPLVLVSSTYDSTRFINPITLQGHLLGLAQVISVDADVDSWEMEAELGKNYSAWGGAINIIFPGTDNSWTRRKLLLSQELESWVEEDRNINLEILSLITHFSNGYHKRKHFSPTDVRSKKQRDYGIQLRRRFDERKDDGDYVQLLEEAMDQMSASEKTICDLKEARDNDIEILELRVMELEDNVNDKEQQIKDSDFKSRTLKEQLKSAGNYTGGESLSPEAVFSAIAGNATPSDVIKIAAQLFPSRILVLDAAYESAKKSISFTQVPKFSKLIFRFCTDYYDGMKNGGENKARSAFTHNEFAAKESETVCNNPTLLAFRKIKYRGNDIAMLRHLKIGVANNAESTIRVHFHWDSEKSFIVIGYCGPHLPISSH